MSEKLGAMINGPRIRGKVGQCTSVDDASFNHMLGKWFFKVWMSEFGSGEAKEEDSLGQFGPWDTEEIAHKEMKVAVQIICEKVSEFVDGKPSGSYIDLKTNVMRKWDKSDEH